MYSGKATNIKKNYPLGFDRLEFLLKFEIEVGWYVCVNLSKSRPSENSPADFCTLTLLKA